ncbi:hypothetical protein JTE90_008491 [Oedothorax gibbosus]|uniref:Uncharacterized protein n=1 Tax=Oedothorax gibbosus TaxID=931172 RepID=A0AAV6UYW6_9ARAC|nr:hypothetical protein JTE90_008491 [Oedothorax gibbosus]
MVIFQSSKIFYCVKRNHIPRINIKQYLFKMPPKASKQVATTQRVIGAQSNLKVKNTVINSTKVTPKSITVTQKKVTEFVHQAAKQTGSKKTKF